MCFCTHGEFWIHCLKQYLFLTAPVLVLAGLCSGMACFYVIFFHTDYKRLHAETISADLVKAEDAVTAHVPES